MPQLPVIASRETWLAARKELLTAEKATTRMLDHLNALRRALPMVPVEKAYLFDTPQGEANLLGLFEGRRRLIVHHVRFPRGNDDGDVDGSALLDHLTHLHACDTTLALVSHAPLTALLRLQARMGWTLPWYSSWGSDFDDDFHPARHEAIAPAACRRVGDTNLAAHGGHGELVGERPGVSVFLRDGMRVFHSYSGDALGLAPLFAACRYLAIDPLEHDQARRGQGLRWQPPRDRDPVRLACRVP